MSEDAAVILEHASKVYRLQGVQPAVSLGAVFGLRRKRESNPTPSHEFVALDDVSLIVGKGERVGLVGRNGAGKTTLLKLLCGNFTATSGTVKVNGSVQALMSMGTGFHPDHTGRRNAEIALKFNGLSPADHALAMADVEDFCELGEFFDQPFKVYSLGMQARLMFAVATAVKPEILVVDEVLGAGDAYFVAKSKLRVERLVKSGCTMILVSHSMSQILELCTRAVWLDKGRVRMDGDAFVVVKAYEEFMHGPIDRIVSPVAAAPIEPKPSGAAEPAVDSIRQVSLPASVRFQEPAFVPHRDAPSFAALADVDPLALMFEAQGGISRWDSRTGVKIGGFSIVTARGVTNEIVAWQPALFVFTLVAEESGTYDLRHGIAINDYLGNCLARIFSPRDTFTLEKGQARRISMLLNPNQIGPGDYVVGISVIEYGPLETINSAARYDLLSRSFELKVVMPDSLAALGSAILHSAEWQFEPLNQT